MDQPDHPTNKHRRTTHTVLDGWVRTSGAGPRVGASNTTMLRFLVALVVGSAFASGCGSSATKSGTTSSVTGGTVTAVTDQSTVIEPTSAATARDTIRVTIVEGCPASVAGHQTEPGTGTEWITNPDTRGLRDQFVPGKPSQALICRYAALDAVTVLPDGRRLQSGHLYTHTTIDQTAANALAAILNDITPSTVASNCIPPADKARYTAIVFAIPGRSDVDLWLKDWIECPEVGNGTRWSGELINGVGSAFLTRLDKLSPPAPQQDFPPRS
jgi:hypothetical protein